MEVMEGVPVSFVGLVTFIMASLMFTYVYDSVVASWLPHVTTHSGLAVVPEHPGSDVFLSICGNVWRFGASTSEAHCC